MINAEPTPFQPFLISNPHFQTIISHFYPVPPLPAYTRLAIGTDDGLASFYVDVANGNSLGPEDVEVKSSRILHYHAPPRRVQLPNDITLSNLKPARPAVVILTGLESHSHAIIPRRMVHAFTPHGFKVFVVNYRSCAHPIDVPKTFRLYHAAFTEDVETLLRAIVHAALESGYRPPEVYMCGFSLGANVMCHFLGRNGIKASTFYNVVAAAGACIPFDPISCQKELDSGWKGYIYSAHLIKTMRDKFFDILRTGADPGRVDVQLIRQADRLGKIDDHFISPTFGFRDRFEYYEHADARNMLKLITVPTLIINARDDPFFSHDTGDSLPTKEHIGSAPVRLYISDYGGHCGFFDRQTLTEKGTGYFQREFAKWFLEIRSSRE